MHLSYPQNLEIVWRDPATIRQNPRNSRTHSGDQVGMIAASIREFGWTTPILLDDDGMILAGHGRLLAAKEIGADMVPTITLHGLTPEQARAYVIADNRIPEQAGWDLEILREELREITEEGGIELEALGYTDADLAELAAGFEEPVLASEKTSRECTCPKCGEKFKP